VVGQQWVITIKSKNTGKTFAKEFRMKATVAKVTSPRTQPDFSDKAIPYNSVSILAPNGEYTSTTVITGNADSPHPIANPTQTDIDLIKSGAIKFFAYGRMDYRDIFQISHWTIFCFHLSRDVKWESCAVHNDADSNPETQPQKPGKGTTNNRSMTPSHD
jgi:hypothetical protein